MKIKLISFTIILLTIALLRIDKSYSYFIEQVKVSATLTAAECFENCDAPKLEPELLFYINSAETEVGFVLNNVGAYDFFEYEVIYDHTTEFGKLTEKIEGEIPNPNYKGTVLEEDIFMGTETTGGMRVNHTGIGEIKLNVFLENSGFIEKTLSKTLNI